MKKKQSNHRVLVAFILPGWTPGKQAQGGWILKKKNYITGINDFVLVEQKISRTDKRPSIVWYVERHVRCRF